MNNQIRKIPENSVCPSNLQILLLNGNGNLIRDLEIPNTFFRIANELKVLDLRIPSRLSEMIPQLAVRRTLFLPQSIGLPNLHSLYLDGFRHIIDISILGQLKNLEILTITNLSLVELSIELGGLTNLRIFNNSRGHIGRIPPGVISKWRNLEELYIGGYKLWQSEKGEEEADRSEASFEEVTSLSKLEVLEAVIPKAECIPKFAIFPDWVKFDITIGSRRGWSILTTYDSRDVYCVKDRFIRLYLDNVSRLPEWFRDGIMEIADRLLWRGCQSFPLLFKNLEQLILYQVNWEKVCATVQTQPPGSLLNLKQLRISDGYTKENLFIPLTILRRLPNLEEIEISSMEEGRYLFGYDEALLSQLLKLRRIELIECGIVRICEGPAPSNLFQNLQNLQIRDCMSLEGSLFTRDVAQCLSQLESLIVINCPLLEKIIEVSHNKIVLPKLKGLHLEALPVLYYESVTFDIECPSLEWFWVRYCPECAVSSDDFHSRKQVKIQRYVTVPDTYNGFVI